jgi:DNA polymerase
MEGHKIMATKIVQHEALERCIKCKLHKTRRNVVKGRGELPCHILLIGDCPGTADDLMEESFMGEVGRLLDHMLSESGILPNCVVYRTNTVLCRATDGKNLITREPHLEEIVACGGNVMQIANEAAPHAVVLMGDIAAKTWHKVFPAAYVIQHPIYLAKTGGQRSPSYLKNIRILEEVYGSIKDGTSN